MTSISSTQNTACVILLYGAPGAGKGTQAEKLAKELQIPHISTGYLFRNEMRKGTRVGYTFLTCFIQKRPIPYTFFIDLLNTRLSESDCTRGYILEGSGTNRQYVDALLKIINNQASIHIFILEAKKETLLTRLQGRITCSSCESSYHTTFHPPKNPSQCDKCHHILMKRDDDQSEETTLRRVDSAMQDLKGIKQFLREKKLLHTVDANAKATEVFKNIIKVVKQQNTMTNI